MRWSTELVGAGLGLAPLLLALPLLAKIRPEHRDFNPSLRARPTIDAPSDVAEPEAENLHEAEIPSKRFYKGNLHAHSLWSDGHDFPENVLDWYRRHGYDFAALTEHNELATGERWLDVEDVRRRAHGALSEYLGRFENDWVQLRTRGDREEVKLTTFARMAERFSENEFLALRGEEITDRVNGAPVHINAFNLSQVVPPQGGDSVEDALSRDLAAISRVGKQAGTRVLAQINHPNYAWAIGAEDLAKVRDARLVEVYNGHPATRSAGSPSHPSVERLWDLANTLRVAVYGYELLLGVAVDDAHRYHAARGALPGRGWVEVRARELSAPALLGALERGDFYASTGVVLNRMEYAPDGIFIEAKAKPGVDYRIDFIGSLRSDETTRTYEKVGIRLLSSHGSRASYRFDGSELFVRAVVTADLPAADGKTKQRAWTQPVLVRRECGGAE